MALVATIGAADSNTYATVAELAAYVPIGTDRLSADIAALASDAKLSADGLSLRAQNPPQADVDTFRTASELLIRSARMIDAIGDRRYAWPGQMRHRDADGDPVMQRLAWPRINATFKDGGFQIPDHVIPPQVKDAQCELAIYIAANPNDASQVIDMLRIVKKEKIEELDVEYMPVKDVETLRRVFTAVEDLLAAILRDRLNDRRVEIENNRARFGMWRIRRSGTAY